MKPTFNIASMFSRNRNRRVARSCLPAYNPPLTKGISTASQPHAAQACRAAYTAQAAPATKTVRSRSACAEYVRRMDEAASARFGTCAFGPAQKMRLVG